MVFSIHSLPIDRCIGWLADCYNTHESQVAIMAGFQSIHLLLLIGTSVKLAKQLVHQTVG
jgi:uncharacterized protein YdeI (YjbR/CyaY-like superfamily)